LIYINAISFYLPEETLSNERIIEEYHYYGGTDDAITSDSIIQQCGIKNRHICPLKDTAKDLGNEASTQLFHEWNIDKKDIDYIIFVSDALEYKGPTTACIMQYNLGLREDLGAIDLLHGCTGWIYGLNLAKSLLLSKTASKVLLVTADVPSKVIHPIDVEIRSIFSDAGAATLISDQPLTNGLNACIQDFVFGTDGDGEKSLWVERSGTREPADVAWLSQHENLPNKLVAGRLHMSSSKIFLFAFRRVPKLIEAILNKHQVRKEDVDYFVLHQANGTMLNFLRKRMKIPEEKFIICIEQTGNTVSASIPLAMKLQMDKKKFKKGDTILVAGFGIGYSWGGTLLKL